MIHHEKELPLIVLIRRQVPMPPHPTLPEHVTDWTLAELGLSGKPKLRAVPLGWACVGDGHEAVGRSQEEAYERWKKRLIGDPHQAQGRVNRALSNQWFKEHDRLVKNAVARYRRLERRSPEWREYEVSG